MINALNMGSPLRLAKLAPQADVADSSLIGALYYNTSTQQVMMYENTSAKWQTLVADGSVTTAKLATDSVTVDKVQASSLGAYIGKTYDIGPAALDLNIAYTGIESNYPVGSRRYGQTFTATGDGKINSIDINYSGSGSGNTTIEVWSVGGDNYPLAQLAVSQTLVNWVDGLNTYTFATPISVTSGTKYAVLLGNALAFRLSSTSYAGGWRMYTNSYPFVQGSFGSLSSHIQMIVNFVGSNTVIGITSVNSDRIANNAITSAKIKDSAVSTSKIAANAITTSLILDSNITESKLASSAVTNTKIADSAITESKLASSSIVLSKIHSSLFGSGIGVTVGAAPSDYTTNSGQTGTAQVSSGSWKFGRTFTAPSSGKLTEVRVNLNNSGTATFRAEIWATDANKVPTTLLGSSNNITSFTAGLNTFTFSTPLALTGGTRYAINLTDGGAAVYRVNGGTAGEMQTWWNSSSWSTAAGAWLMFEMTFSGPDLYGIIADGVTSSKILLANNTGLRSKTSSNADIDLIKISSSDVLTFGTSKYAFTRTALTLTDNVSDTILSAFTLAHATYGGSIINYTIKETAGMRVGRLFIATDGVEASITDDYTETASVGVTWSAVINGANVEVKYSTTDMSGDRTMYADINLFQA